MTTKAESKHPGKLHKSQEPNEENTSNKPDNSYIVIVGETQAGKSSFIKLLHDVNGMQPPKSLEIWTAPVSCTKSTTVYTIQHKFQSYDLKVDPVAKEDGWQTVAVKHTPTLSPVDHPDHTFIVTDTPGLNDSDGGTSDSDHAISILKTFASQKEAFITAILFVVGKGAYSNSLQTNFRYYRQLFKTVSDRFIIVHSRWEFLSKQSEMNERRIKFDELFKDKDTQSYKQYFINSVIPEPDETIYNRFPLHEKALTIIQLNSILQHISILPPVPIKKMQFVKTPIVANCHNLMRTDLNALGTGIQSALNVLQSQFQEMNKKASDLAAKHGKVHAQISASESYLKKINTDAQMKVAEDTIDNPYHFFKPVQTAELSVNAYKDEEGEIYQIEKVVCTLGERQCYWGTDIVFDDKKHSAKRTIKSKFCGGISGTMLAFMKSSNYYKKTIAKLEGALEGLRAQEQVIKAQIDKVTAEYLDKGEQYNWFLTRCNRAGAVQESLDGEEMNVDDYVKTLDVYKIQNLKPQELVEIFCRAMGLPSPYVELPPSKTASSGSATAPAGTEGAASTTGVSEKKN